MILISFCEKCSTLNALFDVVSSLVDGVLADSSVYLFLSMRHSAHSETFVFKAYLEDQTTDVDVLKYRRQDFRHNIDTQAVLFVFVKLVSFSSCLDLKSS